MVTAAEMAENFINNHTNILGNVKLILRIKNGECRTDIVLKSFINYYIDQENTLGILGPACSETVEPIAGLLNFIIIV